MQKFFYLLVLMVAGLVNNTIAQDLPIVLGINLCGGELNEQQMPGTYNEHYAYPTKEEVDYFAKKGFKTVTIPFRWERIQKNIGGDLDYQEVGEIKKVVGWCADKGMQVILSMHNLGRYKKNGIEYIVGSLAVSRNDFAEVWSRIVSSFAGYSNIYGYELMADPHEMQGFDWFTTAQQATNAIREADKKTFIIITGDNYGAPESWVQYSDNLKNIKDPADKILYNAHCYFDIDFTGKYLFGYEQNQVDENAGVKRVMPFVKWLQDNGKKGMIGQFGIPDTDPRWLKLTEVFLKYLADNKINANYWASGKRWNGNPLSLYPLSQTDRPQMSALQAYLKPEPVVETKTAAAEGNVQPEETVAPAQPQTPPESFLFLPGTILLPQPNGGLYKPTPSKTDSTTTTTNIIRVAKYRG